MLHFNVIMLLNQFLFFNQDINRILCIIVTIRKIILSQLQKKLFAIISLDAEVN
jgi:hypothetical protein